ncbi:MAG: vitamin B12 dependent methionine synthase [Spirochaetota bacterium]
MTTEMDGNTVITGLPFSLRANQVLETLRPGKAGPSLERSVAELVDRARPVANPKAVYRPVYVELAGDEEVRLDGVTFTSGILRENLRNAGRVFPYVVTAGRELENVEVPGSDIMTVFCMDAVKEMILEQAVTFLERHLKERYALGPMAHMNPGSLGEWPISEQKQLFRLLGDVEGMVGVRLTGSLLMEPVKSVSGIHFPTEVDFKSCMLCTRHPCSKRKAEYDPEKARRYRG